jgi:hypothetical protein
MKLKCVDQIDLDDGLIVRVFDSQTLYAPRDLTPSELSLVAGSATVSRLSVRFLTPVELKHGQQIASHPEFGILMARIRDRLSALSSLYGDGPLDMDFAEFGNRAERVVMTRCEVMPVEVTRLSRRTGRRHPMGGFVGKAEYQGVLAEFVPFLRAARFSGVGRQTTWGKGEIELCST